MDLGYVKYRALWERRHLNRPLAKRRLVQHLADTVPPYKIHVGAFDTELPGWVNTDITFEARYWLDVLRPWPFPAASASHIFSDNVIEHLPLSGGRTFLQASYAALRRGGRIRTVTPDAGRSVAAYLNTPSEVLADMRRDGLQAEHPVDILRSAFSLWGHHAGYIYDEAALSAELKDAGFVDIERFESGESRDPVLRGIDSTRDGHMMVCLEAVRP